MLCLQNSVLRSPRCMPVCSFLHLQPAPVPLPVCAPITVCNSWLWLYTAHFKASAVWCNCVHASGAHTSHTPRVRESGVSTCLAHIVYTQCTHLAHTLMSVWLFACAGARISPRTPREMQKHMLTSSTVQPAVLREQARRREKRESAATSISQKGHACCWIDFNVVCAAILR